MRFCGARRRRRLCGGMNDVLMNMMVVRPHPEHDSDVDATLGEEGGEAVEGGEGEGSPEGGGSFRSLRARADSTIVYYSDFFFSRTPNKMRQLQLPARC